MINSNLQVKISRYLKSTESGDGKQKNGIGRFAKKFVKITQSPVERKISHLQRKSPPVEKHSSLSPLPKDQSSPLSQNTDLKQQNTPKQPACSLADALAVVKLKNSKTEVVPKGPVDKNATKSLLQELKTKFAEGKSKTDQVTDDISDKPLNWIQREIAQSRAAYAEPSNQEAMRKKEAAEDARVAKEREKESAQQAGNNTSTEAEQFKVDLKFDANGVPTSAPPLPPSLSLTPSRGIELKPQDKSKQQTSTLVKALPNDLMQQLNEKLAKIRVKVDNDPALLLAEKKEEARLAKTRAEANELAQQAGNNTSTEAEQFKVELKFDANGVPTSAPPLPPSF